MGATTTAGRGGSPGHVAARRASVASLAWLLLGLSVPALVLAAVQLQAGFSYRELLNDPADTVGYHPLVGVVSNLGLLFWAAAVGVASLTAAVLRERGDDRALAWFFVASASFSLLLLADDALLLHETMLPKLLSVRERWIKVAYLGLALLYLVLSARYLQRFGLLLVLAVGAFFAASLVLDNPATTRLLGVSESGFWLYFLEDGAKFLGISAWLTFMVKASFEAITARMA